MGPTTESQNVLAIGLELRRLLTAAGANVIMTRSTDVDPSVGTQFERVAYGQLLARVAVANANHAHVFVSIHNNSHPDPQIKGTQTYYDPNHKPSSRPLADAIHKELLKALGTQDKGVLPANFLVITDTVMPSVLVEVAFVSNAQEAQALATTEYRRRAAVGIYNGLIRYFSTVSG